MYLSVNQVHGLNDLAQIATLTNLRFLSLYGLPGLRIFPSLRTLSKLSRVEIGQVKNLEILAGFFGCAEPSGVVDH